MREFRSTNSGVSARPCEVPGIDRVIHESLRNVNCYSNDIHDVFLNEYFSILMNSRNNNLSGLGDFSSKTYIHGTTQAFDEFYLRHHDKRLRTFPGEFAYHKVAARSGRLNWLEIDEKNLLETGDCLILSVPFSASCDVYDGIDEIFDTCDAKNIPVHLDFAYLGISKGIDLNLQHSAIYSLSFSLSKVYFGIERLRVGIRLKRSYEDDYLDFSNEFRMYNIAGACAGLHLLQRLSPDSLYDLLNPVCEEVIKERHYRENKTCIFASVPKGHVDYERCKRGNSKFSRICLSEIISDRLHDRGFVI